MYNRSWGHWQDLTELQSSSPPQISKNSMLKYQHVEMWQKSKEKRFPYKCLSSPPKNHFKIWLSSKWKEAWILQPWHHSGPPYNRSRDPTMCSLQRPHSPVLLSSLFIVSFFVVKATFVFGTSEKVKFSSTLMLPDSKGIWKCSSKNDFLPDLSIL